MDNYLSLLYDTFFGRMLLRILVCPSVSKLCGAFLDSFLSKPLIRPFVTANSIDMSEYVSGNFKCFNDCFARRIKPGMRPVDPDPLSFVSPCDSRLSVYEIEEGTVIPVKQSRYSIARLLHSRKLAARYEGG